VPDQKELLCEERHKNVDSRLDTHENRLNGQDNRIDKIENNQIRSEVMIQNLCEQIKALVGLVKNVLLGAAGFIMVTGIGFIIWYIQTH
jgi:uncharacterized coiled-coil protein SlyX